VQVLSFREGQRAFLAATTVLDARKELKKTKWGRRYLYFLWSGAILLVLVSGLTARNPVLAFPAGYFSMMFAREVMTLKPTFELQRMQPGQR
jgi:hypothetical protein